MSKKFCERCGKELHHAAKGSLCRECSILANQERHEKNKQKQIEARERKILGQPPAPGLVGERPGKHRCVKCGHAFKYDLTSDVACGYINDAKSYELPRRPHPSADPNQCIYWSAAPSHAGWFTEKDKQALYDPNLKPVLDISKCQIYKSIGTASAVLGIPYIKIKEECESTDDINADRRWRYLKPEEILVIKPKEV